MASEEQASINSEPVQYEDVVDYYQSVIADLHAKLAVARAQIRNRDRALEALRGVAAQSGLGG